MTVDAPALWAGLVDSKLNGTTVDLPLFADLRVTLPTASLDVRPDGISWVGRSTNWVGPTREAIISVSYPGRFRADADALVGGEVWSGNREVRIDPLGGRVLAFTELDPAAMLPPDAPSPGPFGSLDSIDRSVGAVVVKGWALDLDTTSPLTVHIYVDNVAVATTANLSRPDVGAAYPGYGDNHGYQAVVNMSSGTHTICAYGINIGAGASNGTLGCQVYNASGNPFGSYTTHDYPGGVRFDGWAVDPDTGNPIDVHGYVDTTATAQTASLNRPDIAALYPLAGPNHGFDNLVMPAGHGTHTACAYGINSPASPGGNTLLNPGCPTINLTGVPYGSYGAAKTGTSVRVQGWALDPDVADPITVHIYIDTGQPATPVLASGNRPDIAAAYPGYGPNHGFDTTIGPLTPGPHQVCAYGINNETGAANPLLNPGCITVTT